MLSSTNNTNLLYAYLSIFYVYIRQLPIRKDNLHPIILVCPPFHPSQHISLLCLPYVLSPMCLMAMVGPLEIDGES